MRSALGLRVELVGLGDAHFNGTLATITGPLNDKGRWEVATDEGRLLSARRASLCVVAGTGAAGETEGGASEAPAATAAGAGASATTAGTIAAKTCSWPACGNDLSGEAAAKNRCGRCKRAYYCSRRCHKKDWKEGGHKKACKEVPSCTICLDDGDDPLPMQRGCACRGDAGLAHVACQATAATHKDTGSFTAA